MKAGMSLTCRLYHFSGRDMKFLTRALWVILPVVANGSMAADMRDRVRLPRADERPPVTEAQASDLTLTLTETAVRPIQSWLRTDGVLGSDGKVITVRLPAEEAGHISLGQRARAFPADSKASMYQARITRITQQGNRSQVEATLSGVGHIDARYLLEIVVERGEFLSVPNEAIIEEGDHRVVYVQQAPGDYEPRNVSTGLQGERYTQVIEGLSPGEQVVTTGSFFIDAEYKMKGGN